MRRRLQQEVHVLAVQALDCPFLNQVRRPPLQLQTSRDDAHDKRLTLKQFRAGHATHLAARGSHLSETMQAGEWKSKAFLDYCDPDTIDAVVFLNATLDASDNEGDE